MISGCSKEEPKKEVVEEVNAEVIKPESVKEKEPVEKKVETPKEPLLLEQGEWNLEALLKYVP